MSRLNDIPILEIRLLDPNPKKWCIPVGSKKLSQCILRWAVSISDRVSRAFIGIHCVPSDANGPVANDLSVTGSLCLISECLALTKKLIEDCGIVLVKAISELVNIVLFALDPQKPEFEIRVRAQRFYPDMFYTTW